MVLHSPSSNSVSGLGYIIMVFKWYMRFGYHEMRRRRISTQKDRRSTSRRTRRSKTSWKDPLNHFAAKPQNIIVSEANNIPCAFGANITSDLPASVQNQSKTRKAFFGQRQQKAAERLLFAMMCSAFAEHDVRFAYDASCGHDACLRHMGGTHRRLVISRPRRSCCT